MSHQSIDSAYKDTSMFPKIKLEPLPDMPVGFFRRAPSLNEIRKLPNFGLRVSLKEIEIENHQNPWSYETTYLARFAELAVAMSVDTQWVADRFKNSHPISHQEDIVNVGNVAFIVEHTKNRVLYQKMRFALEQWRVCTKRHYGTDCYACWEPMQGNQMAHYGMCIDEEPGYSNSPPHHGLNEHADLLARSSSCPIIISRSVLGKRKMTQLESDRSTKKTAQYSK